MFLLGLSGIVFYVFVFEVYALQMQGLMLEFHKPFFLIALQQCLLMLFAVPYLACRCRRPHALTRTDLRDAAILTVFLTLIGVTFALALPHVIVALATCLGQIQSVVIYLLSIPVLNERITHRKTLSVLITIAGAIVMILLGKATGNFNHDQKWYGYVLVLGTILSSSIYSILFKKLRANKNKLIDTFGLVTLMGLVTFSCSWVFFVILHFTDLEKFEIPAQHHIQKIILTSLCKPFMNLAMLCTVCITSPLFFQVGMVLLVPAGMIAETITKQLKVNDWFWAGLVSIVIGWTINVYDKWIEVRLVKDEKTDEKSSAV